MATLEQFEANRRNPQKPTGPKTPKGKSAVGMNALRHGLRARSAVLPGEDTTEFHRLCNDLEAAWICQSRTEQLGGTGAFAWLPVPGNMRNPSKSIGCQCRHSVKPRSKGA